MADGLRRQIAERAGHCCEYCHLPTAGQVGRFPIDHVIPRSLGGATDLSNLALACPSCNGHKWARVSAPDPLSGQPVPLFNPRTQVWSDHFGWSAVNPVLLEGLTPTGRATVAALQMNHPDVQLVRRLLGQVGIPLGPGTAIRLL